ncbi:unnamed protein product [Trichobilharzia regenti]|nr:unnamed protein product [Trichobilharzia regenti]
MPPPPPPPPAKDPIGWTLPLEPILQPIIPINQSNPLPSPSPICIPPPPPPPQFVGVGVGAGLGRGQQSFSPPPPPPPLPSTLNELTGYHHIPTAVLGGGGVVVAPPLPRPRPLPPPPPPPLLCPPPLVVQPPISPALHMDKINMISNDYNNNNNLLTKSIEPNVLIPPKVTTASSTAAAAPPPPLPTSTANSSATTQSQNYSAFDLLKNLCQSNVTMSGSGLSKPSSSSVSLPTFPLSSTIPASSSISKEYSRSIPCEQAINSTVSATGRPDGSGGGGDLLNPSKVSHTLMHETNSNPLVNSDDNNTTTTTTTTNNNNKSTEDPFAIISRLTGLSNLIKK